ncbi:hypothetical protein D9758_015597 [Tetrapyrgos nigripes]|uniref:F-box domain-containing protein n=1 Tax=Tetrapyrgos nigripes TaxID=182062 RepID=A0A8H5CDE3_9AGAR|nr:hypothetical protein D9758_015597 [Tetrapyrgos nigripes]
MLCCDEDIKELQQKLDRLKHKRHTVETYLRLRDSQRAPIRKLPAEILAEIFHLFCNEEGLAFTGTKKLPQPLILSAVCLGWRTVAFANPRLWSKVDVDLFFVAKPSYTEVIRASVTRSRRLPLYLNIHGRPQGCAWEDLLCYLVELAPRWEHLSYNLNADRGTLRRVFSSLNALPCLKSLDVRVPAFLPCPFFSALRQAWFRNHSDTMSKQLTPHTTSLTTLRLANVLVDEIFRLLVMDCCKSLTSLSLLKLFGDYGESEFEEMGLISLPHLDDLEISGSCEHDLISTLPHLYEYLDLPSLPSLTLSTSIYCMAGVSEQTLVEHVANFINYTQCTSLQTLSLSSVHDLVSILRLVPDLKSFRYHSEAKWGQYFPGFVSSMTLSFGEANPILPSLQELEVVFTCSIFPLFDFEAFSDMIRSRWKPENADGLLERVEITVPIENCEELMCSKGYCAMVAMQDEGLDFEVVWKD